jgi:hypothetical protein
MMSHFKRFFKIKPKITELRDANPMPHVIKTILDDMDRRFGKLPKPTNGKIVRK